MRAHMRTRRVAAHAGVDAGWRAWAACWARSSTGHMPCMLPLMPRPNAYSPCMRPSAPLDGEGCHRDLQTQDDVQGCHGGTLPLVHPLVAKGATAPFELYTALRQRVPWHPLACTPLDAEGCHVEVLRPLFFLSVSLPRPSPWYCSLWRLRRGAASRRSAVPRRRVPQRRAACTRDDVEGCHGTLSRVRRLIAKGAMAPFCPYTASRRRVPWHPSARTPLRVEGCRCASAC
jgi:hypothetical protein